MNNLEYKKQSLEVSLEELLRENEEIKMKIKSLLRKHASNHEEIDKILQELTNLGLGKETFLMKLWRHLSKFLFGRACTQRRIPRSSENFGSSGDAVETEGDTSTSGEIEAAISPDPVLAEDTTGSYNGKDGQNEISKPIKRKMIVETEGSPEEDLVGSSKKKMVFRSDSIDDNVFLNCPTVLVPTSSFGKDICMDLTGFTATPASGQDSPAVFLFGELEKYSRKGEEESETLKVPLLNATPLTLEEK